MSPSSTLKKGSSLFGTPMCHLPLYPSLVPIFACFGSPLCFCFWSIYRTENSLILAHSSCFIKGLSWFEASFIHFMLYLSFGPHFCIAFWTYFHIVLGPAINCKMLYFWPLFKGPFVFKASNHYLLLWPSFGPFLALEFIHTCAGFCGLP